MSAAAHGVRFASLRKQTARALPACGWPRVLGALAAEYAALGPLSVVLVRNNLTAIAVLRVELSAAVNGVPCLPYPPPPPQSPRSV